MLWANRKLKLAASSEEITAATLEMSNANELLKARADNLDTMTDEMVQQVHKFNT